MENVKQARHEAESLKADANNSLTLVNHLIINQQTELEYAVIAAAEVKDRIKEVESKPRELIEPLKNTIKKIEALFKPALDSLKNCEKGLKDKIGQYINNADTMRQSLLLEVQSTEDTEQREHSLKRAEQYRVSDISGMSIRTKLKGRVIDPSRIPREYLAPDLKKLNEATSNDGEIDIPGWEVETQSTVSITSGRVQR